MVVIGEWNQRWTIGQEKPMDKQPVLINTERETRIFFWFMTLVLVTMSGLAAINTPELLRLKELLDEARAMGDLQGARITTDHPNATLWDELLSLGSLDTRLEQWREQLRRLTNARPPEPVCRASASRMPAWVVGRVGSSSQPSTAPTP